MKFTIKNYELADEVEVEAPGIIEAILEYLPWPTLQIKIDYSPMMGEAFIIDLKTKFKYRVRLGGR